jgi:creatinine amidohydrolase
MRHWILAETNYGYLKQNPVDVAVLVMGATEPHNLHLPYGTDTFEGTEIGARACEAAYQRGAKVILLPPMPYGTQTNMAAFPLAMNLHPTTLLAILRDLCGSLDLANVRKLVILNSHGGNDFKWALRELANQTPVKLFLCDWFRGLAADAQREIFEHPEDHAGEMETSLGLAFFPDLVAKNPDGSLAADDGTTRPTRFDAVNRGWVSISRPWHLLTTNTGSGYPHAASAEKGRKLMEIVSGRLADFLVELAASPVDDAFPF